VRVFNVGGSRAKWYIIAGWGEFGCNWPLWDAGSVYEVKWQWRLFIETRVGGCQPPPVWLASKHRLLDWLILTLSVNVAGIPAVVVGISLGITQAIGYGNKD
jgi:hypothetical protein